jgi:hypothetical protein
MDIPNLDKGSKLLSTCRTGYILNIALWPGYYPKTDTKQSTTSQLYVVQYYLAEDPIPKRRSYAWKMEGILSNKAKSGAMEESKQEVEGVPLDGVMRKSRKWRMHSNQKGA